ncbi:WhiB family transcriptional regulator [Nocardioides maradonensis]
MSWQFAPEINWARDAACRTTGISPRLQRALADRFFADHRPTVDIQRCCKACPVREQCLQFALENDEEGYWGGMSETARRRLKGAS